MAVPLMLLAVLVGFFHVAETQEGHCYHEEDWYEHGDELFFRGLLHCYKKKCFNGSWLEIGLGCLDYIGRCHENGTTGITYQTPDGATMLNCRCQISNDGYVIVDCPVPRASLRVT